MSTPVTRRSVLAAALAAPAAAALPSWTSHAATGTTILSSNLESATVASPISVADMQTFLGDTTQVGGASTYAFTSVKWAAGRDKLSTKVLSQRLARGTYGMPGNGHGGTGIAINGVNVAGAPVYEASIQYDVRFVGSGQWPFGGKLPGLGGMLVGHGNPPTGGSPSPYGWSGRLMHRRTQKDNPSAPGKLVGYVYDPTQIGAGTVGQDRETGVELVWGRWYRVKQSYRMNNVITEGVAGRPNGVHRIWVDDVLVFEKTDQIFRVYEQAKVTHYLHDVFLGGNDPAWNAPADLDVHIDNLLITNP
jgi:hypothetical protein